MNRIVEPYQGIASAMPYFVDVGAQEALLYPETALTVG
jgi:hypothetical protein